MVDFKVHSFKDNTVYLKCSIYYWNNIINEILPQDQIIQIIYKLWIIYSKPAQLTDMYIYRKTNLFNLIHSSIRRVDMKLSLYALSF